MIDVVCGRWKQTAEAADIGKHPKVWVGYWNDTFRGSLSMTGWNEEAIFSLASPFGVSGIACEAVVFDHAAGCLNVTELSIRGKGVSVLPHTVPYTITDAGVYVFDEPQRKPGIPRIEQMLSEIGLTRLRRDTLEDFNVAYMSARLLAEAAL